MTQALKTVISFDEIDAALSRCMAAHPPVAPEFILHEDASRMAGLWAEMLLAGAKSEGFEDERIWSALRRWKP